MRAKLSDGSRVILRPVSPEDKSLIRHAFARLSEESRYRRFFTPMTKLPETTLVYLTDVDHHDHEAIVAVPEDGVEVVGVARYVRDQADPGVAEAAITVIDDWQGRGLGGVLLRRLAARARQEGVRRFTALVKVENPAALELLRGLGPTEITRAGSEVELLIDLPRRGAGLKLARALRAAAAGTVSLADDMMRRVGGSGRAP